MASMNKDNSYHYNAARNYNIGTAICLFGYIVSKLISNDLFFPITDALVNHDVFITIINIFMVIFWLFSKLFFYYGFTMLYVALFEKERVGTKCKVLMALLFV